MCSAVEALTEKAKAEGKAEGMAKGLAEGKAEGKAIGIILYGRLMQTSDDEIIKSLVEICGMSKEEAEKQFLEITAAEESSFI